MAKNKPDILPPLPFSSPEFIEAWRDWEEYRKEELKKKPYTAKGMNRMFNRLLTMGESKESKCIELLINAMQCEWSTVWPIKTHSYEPKQQRHAIKTGEGYGKF